MAFLIRLGKRRFVGRLVPYQNIGVALTEESTNRDGVVKGLHAGTGADKDNYLPGRTVGRPYNRGLKEAKSTY